MMTNTTTKRLGGAAGWRARARNNPVLLARAADPSRQPLDLARKEASDAFDEHFDSNCDCCDERCQCPNAWGGVDGDLWREHCPVERKLYRAHDEARKALEAYDDAHEAVS